MSVQALAWVIENSEATLGKRCLMFAVANYADKHGEGCWASVDTLAADARLSKRGCQNALRELERAGELTRAGKSQYGTTIWHIAGMEGGADSASPGRSSVSQGVNLYVETEHGTAPKPSTNPSEEPQGEVIDPSMMERKRRSGAVRYVFKRWSELYAPRAVFDDKRAARIGARLDERVRAGESTTEAAGALVSAIENARLDPWLTGEKEGSPGYLKKLETLLRDAAQVERLLDLEADDELDGDDWDEDADRRADLIHLHGADSPLVKPWLEKADDDDEDPEPAA